MNLSTFLAPEQSGAYNLLYNAKQLLNDPQGYHQAAQALADPQTQDFVGKLAQSLSAKPSQNAAPGGPMQAMYPASNAAPGADRLSFAPKNSVTSQQPIGPQNPGQTQPFGVLANAFKISQSPESPLPSVGPGALGAAVRGAQSNPQVPALSDHPMYAANPFSDAVSGKPAAAPQFQSMDDYYRQHPENDPANHRPRQVPIPKHQGWLSFFEGLQDVGANLMGAAGPHATQARLQRQTEQQREDNEFEENLPVKRAQAYNSLYAQPLMNQANLAHIQAETKNLEFANPAMQKKEQLLSSLQSDLEKGVIPSDQARQKYMDLAQAGNVPLNPIEIDNIIQHTKAVGPSYSIQADHNGRPMFLTDRQGNRILPDAKGKFSDPNAQSLWDAEQGAHQQSLKEEVDKEQRMADIHEKSQDRANAFAIDRQGKMFANQQEKTVEGQALKHLEALNQNDTQFNEVQQLAAHPNSANDKFLVMKALGVALPEGVKRINQTELNTIASVGGLSQRAQGELGSWTVGTTFTPQTRAEIVNAAKLIHDNKAQGEQKNLQTLQNVYGNTNPRISQLAGQGGGAAAPETHIFSKSAFKRANPNADVDMAAASAQAHGYQVVE